MQSTISTNPELKVRKIMGRTYLNQSKLEEALEVYAGILRDFPDDLDALIVLGNLYLAAGDSRTACSVYRRALEIDPQNVAVSRQLELAESEEGGGLAEKVPTDPAAIRRLLQRLTGKTGSISDADLHQAAELLELILHSPNPAEQVAIHLEEIDDLLPALLELNIRQAEADGRPDLADGLRALQDNIHLQMQPAAAAAIPPAAAPRERFHGSVLLLLPDPAHPSERIRLLQEGLAGAGCAVTLSGEFTIQAVRDGELPHVAVASNPHIQPRMLESLAALTAANVPVLVDLDTDFEHMPVTHPDYSTAGLGSPARARAYTAALLLANAVTVNSAMLAESLRQAGHNVYFMPDGWSNQNLLWTRTPQARSSIHIGWIGGSGAWLGGAGQIEDLMLVRRTVLRILREFPHTQLVVIGDLQAYRLFDSLAETRRMYLPMVPAEEFPYLLGQLDILIVPLRNQPYASSLSDLPLVQAGVKGIPWVASPITAFKNWQAGGLVADTPEEWHLYLRQLVLDAETRAGLGQAGQQAALKREASNLSQGWVDLFEQLLQPSFSIR